MKLLVRTSLQLFLLSAALPDTSFACATFDVVCKAKEAAAAAAAAAQKAQEEALAAYKLAVSATNSLLAAEGMQALNSAENLANPDLWMSSFVASSLPKLGSYSVTDAGNAAREAVYQFLGTPTADAPFGAAEGRKLWSMAQAVVSNVQNPAGTLTDLVNHQFDNGLDFGNHLRATLPFDVPTGAYFAWGVGAQFKPEEISVVTPGTLGLVEAKQSTSVTFPFVWGGFDNVGNLEDRLNQGRFNFIVSTSVGAGSKNELEKLSAKLQVAIEVIFNISCSTSGGQCQLRYIGLNLPKIEIKKSIKNSGIAALKSLKATLSNPLAKASPALLAVLDKAIVSAQALLSFQNSRMGLPSASSSAAVQSDLINSKAVATVDSATNKMNKPNKPKWALTSNWFVTNETSLQFMWFNDDEANGLFSNGWNKRGSNVDLVLLSDTAKTYYEAKLSKKAGSAELSSLFQAPGSATLGVLFALTSNGRLVEKNISDYVIPLGSE